MHRLEIKKSRNKLNWKHGKKFQVKRTSFILANSDLKSFYNYMKSQFDCLPLILTWRVCLPEVWNCAWICLATVASSLELTDFSSWFTALSPTPFWSRKIKWDLDVGYILKGQNEKVPNVNLEGLQNRGGYCFLNRRSNCACHSLSHCS